MSGWSDRVRVPLGPLTVSVPPVDGHVDRGGDGDGQASDTRHRADLPDEGEDFAAQLRLTRLLAGHDPLARADDDDAQAAEHARDVGLAGVDPQAGLADALEPGDDRDLAVDVLEREAEDRGGPSCSSVTSAMKPSSLRMRAISRLVRDAGTTTSVCRAREAFRTRVSMSAIGSEMFIVFLPARLGDAGQLAAERALAEADPAQGEPPHVRARSPAHEAAVVAAGPCAWGSGFALAIIDFLAIVSPPRAYEAKGMPRSSRSFLDSSSVFAVVTMLISSPRRRSTLS